MTVIIITIKILFIITSVARYRDIAIELYRLLYLLSTFICPLFVLTITTKSK